MGFTLSREEQEELKVDKYIVDRLVACMAQLKQCRSEAERQDYHVVLGAVAPTRESQGSPQGMIRAVCARLRVSRGSRYIKSTGETRPRAMEQAILRRAEWDEGVTMYAFRPFQVGDNVTSRGRPCVVLDINHDADTCKLRFSAAEGAFVDRDYAHIYKGNSVPGSSPFPKGSARLRHAPLSLRPHGRLTRHDAKLEDARPKVVELFEAEGARSPSQQDVVRRRLGVRLFETAQTLYIYAKYASLYAIFLVRYPANKISFTTFKRLVPWYVRRAKQETCLCKQCENFKNYKHVLNSFVKLFENTFSPPSIDAEDNGVDGDDDDAEGQQWAGKEALQRLMKFCFLNSKSEMVKFCLCDGALNGAGKLDCLDGTCSNEACGFPSIWSKSLRKLVVDKDGCIRDSAPIEFMSCVTWTRAKSGAAASPGEPKVAKYSECHGTVVDFLDEFEVLAWKKYPLHRHTVSRQKHMAAQFARERCPGWLHFDVDFAMDGEIPPPFGRAIQSDHWCPMTYTLFILVASWLEKSAWVSRDSVLSRGDEVTVELESVAELGALHPATGSYWAEVITVPTTQGETPQDEQKYGVRSYGADDVHYVARKLLRHRRRHTKAFIHISDDKTHDSHAAQCFINKTLQYLEDEYMKTGKETFFGLHMHSDNAPSHFKSSQTMNHVTTLPARLMHWCSSLGITFRVFWEFGPPGHGKGVWDGLGAWMKRTIRQDITDDRPSYPTLQTSDRKILNPSQVAEHLKAIFDTDAYVSGHVDATINQVVVLYTPTGDILRPVGYKFTAMPGMKKTHLFMAIREGVTLQRRYACWCPSCMCASAPGEGSMDSNYYCKDCVSPSLEWKETVVEREDAPGLMERR